MNRQRTLLIILGMAFCLAQGHAQSIGKGKARRALDDFRREARAGLESFRKKCMDEFIAFVRDPWKEFEETPPVPAPKDDPVPPVVIPEEDKDKPVEDKPVVIEDVVTPPKPEPQPQPVEPIEEVPVVQEKTVDFTFFGTQGRVRCDTSRCPSLRSISNGEIADALKELASEEFDNLVYDCLHLRDSLQLSDWAYLQMLRQMAAAVAGQHTDGATLLLAYVYMQSGYKMRLATDGSHLYMLYASKHQIFEQGAYDVDGVHYYGLDGLPDRLSICKAPFPRERELSLLVPRSQKLARDLSEERTIASKDYDGMKLTARVNKNLMAFYDGLDYARIARQIDLVSWDCYPQYHERPGETEELAARFGLAHDYMRSLKHGKPFLMMESCPGPTNWYHHNRLLRPGQHRMKSIQAVAHGSDSVQYFQIRKGRVRLDIFSL